MDFAIGWVHGRAERKIEIPHYNIVPRFLVILAAFNGTRFLREQIDSILAQSCVEVRIVISVDKSSDGTETMVDSLVKEDHRITALPFSRVFGGAAPNFFRLIAEIRLESFDYLSFADQDDIWFPEKLLRAHKVIQRTKASGYSSNVLAFWSSGRKILIRKSQPQRRWDFLFESPGPGCTFVLDRTLAQACQTMICNQLSLSLPAIGFHDWFIYALARSQGFEWHIDCRPGLLYRQHDHNQIGVNAGMRSWLRRSLKIFSGWGFNQARLTARLMNLENNPFVKPWIMGQRMGLLELAFKCGQCRRRKMDRVLFAVSCLLMALHLPQRNKPW